MIHQGWGLFDEATADNALLDKSVATWDRSKAIIVNIFCVFLRTTEIIRHLA